MRRTALHRLDTVCSAIPPSKQGDTHVQSRRSRKERRTKDAPSSFSFLCLGARSSMHGNVDRRSWRKTLEAVWANLKGIRSSLGCPLRDSWAQELCSGA